MSKGLPDYQQLTAPVEAPVKGHDVTVVTTQPGLSVNNVDTKPENYLALSLFTCLCCCWVFGLIALVMSLRVDSAWSSGDFVGAKRASTQAKQFSIVGIVCGGIIAGVIGVLIFLQIVAAIVLGATGKDDDGDDHDGRGRDRD